MTQIKLFMVLGAFMMGLIYFQTESAILLAAQLPATEVNAGIIVVLGTVEFALRYYQMKLAQAQNESDLWILSQRDDAVVDFLVILIGYDFNRDRVVDAKDWTTQAFCKAL